ncbi:MAG: ABC transporter permease, partial [Elusimicrobiota bacterium]
MSSPVTRIGLLLYVRHRWQILFFSSCIAAGVAFLFSVGNLLSSIDRAIARGARELMAADVRVSSSRPIGGSALETFERLTREGVRRTRIVSFASMLRPRTGTPFLVSIKAVEEAYPFYGELVVEPSDYREDFFSGKACLIDGSIALQHGLAVGDRVKLGGAELTVRGIVRREPDRGLSSFSLAPRLFVPMTALRETGLLRTGSRIRHRMLLAAPP